MKRKVISEDERELLIANKYIKAVTVSNIYYTDEFKNIIYQEHLKGKSYTKILKEHGIPLTDTVVSRISSLTQLINIQRRKKNTNYKTISNNQTNKTIIDKQYTDLEKENEILRQQIEFLKKISN